MAKLTTQAIALAGTKVVPVAASAGGDKMANDGKTILRIVNGAGAGRTVTVTAVQTTAVVPGFGTLPRGNIAVVTANGETWDVGPFPTAFNDANGDVGWTYSSEAGLTVAAVRVEPVV